MNVSLNRQILQKLLLTVPAPLRAAFFVVLGLLAPIS